MNKDSSLLKELTEFIPAEPEQEPDKLDDEVYVVSCHKTTLVPACCADSALQTAMELNTWDTVDWAVEWLPEPKGSSLTKGNS